MPSSYRIQFKINFDVYLSWFWFKNVQKLVPTWHNDLIYKKQLDNLSCYKNKNKTFKLIN